MNSRDRKLRPLLSVAKTLAVAPALCALAITSAQAADGDMGAGIPDFGLYSSATGSEARVWRLIDPTKPFPAGCSQIILRPETMGLDTYKLAVATMTAARLMNKRVRFYAHAPRDGGCGVDYIQLVD